LEVRTLEDAVSAIQVARTENAENRMRELEIGEEIVEEAGEEVEMMMESPPNREENPDQVAYRNIKHTCYCHYKPMKGVIKHGVYRTYLWEQHKARKVHQKNIDHERDAVISELIKAFNPKNR
jgi:uncharacterized protein (UPF0297 family)